MRIPKPVNTFLDWVEGHAGALAAVVALSGAAAAAMWIPVLAGFILGLAVGGFAVHLRLSKRIFRARREVDDLLRENGRLRHRNRILTSGVITREAQVTQALVAIPEEIEDIPDAEPAALEQAEEEPEEDPQRTRRLPALEDEPPGEAALAADGTAEPGRSGAAGPDGEAGAVNTGADDGGPDGDATEALDIRALRDRDADPAGRLTDLTGFVGTRGGSTPGRA